MRKRIVSFFSSAIIMFSIFPLYASGAQVSLPNLKSRSYDSNLNPYTAAGYKDACTWYAWGRANEVLGVKLPAWSHAITWYESARNAGFTVGSDPRAGSIAVWSGSGGYGHVAYVEEVTNTYVHVTEGGWSGRNGGYAGHAKCHSERVPLERMKKGVVRHPTSWHNDVLIGYIYLRGLDTTPPVISNVQVTDVSSSGYTVSCDVTDNLSVARVQFGTYVAKRGKKSLPKNWQQDGRFSGTNIEGTNTYVFRVNDSDHGGARGEYCTLITAFDTDGNKRNSRLLRTNVKNDATEAGRVMLGNVTYILYNDTLTYEKAQKRCEAAGGHLATITNHNEQMAVESLLNLQPRDAYFIGGDLLAGSWQWTTGEPFKYTRWAAMQPDNSGGKNVMVMLQGGKNVKAGTWASANTNRKATGYIMEIAPAKNGWVRQAGKLYYYQDNKRLTGWQTINNKIFYLDETEDRTLNGSVLTGWQTIKGRKFYFNPSKTAGRSGAMFMGWQKIKGKRFYFNERGKFGVNLGSMASGWKKVKGKTFYFNEEGGDGVKGRMLLGWRNIDGKTYFMRGSGKDGDYGASASGWQKIKGKQFYFKQDKSGKPFMVTGWNKINGGWYYFTTNGTSASRGRMLAGLRKIDGKIYYLNASKADGNFGRAATGWTTVKDNVYYFTPKGKAGEVGAAYTGKQTIDGKRFSFDEKGICKNPPSLFEDKK